MSKNETLTRYALIDPLLRALDWDTEDPVVVVPEYEASGGRVDYALLDSKGKPGARTCEVNTQPVHPSGKAFTSPAQVGSFYFSKHASAMQMLSRTAFVMRNVGMDPALIRVSFRDNNS